MPNALATSRNWITYAPSRPFNPDQGIYPDETQIRTDLQRLFNEGWRGLVTYSLDSTLASVPRIAKEVGFSEVIAGLYWFDDAQLAREKQAALAQVDSINGYVVGNEGLFFHRYSRSRLEAEIAALRAATGRPVTTSETEFQYRNDPTLLNLGDWVFPTFQTWFPPASIRDPSTAVAAVLSDYQDLQRLAPTRTIIVKESWWPTDGALYGEPSATEANQVRFFQQLAATPVRFVWGEAYDQFWKTAEGPQGPHWGFHRDTGEPKAIVSALSPIYTQSYLPSSVSVTRFGSGPFSPEVFVLGLDRQVYAQKFDANGNSTTGYFLVAPGQVKSFTVGRVAARSGSQPRLFAIGLDDQVYQVRFDANGDPSGGYTLTQPGQVKAIGLGRTNLITLDIPELFVIGLDDQVYAQTFDQFGNSTRNYTLTTPGRVKALDVGTIQNGTTLSPELFVLGLDDQVYAQVFDPNGQSTSPYFLTAPGAVKSFRVGSLPGVNSATPELFAIGLDDQLYSQTFAVVGNSTGGYRLTTPGRIKSFSVGSVVSGLPEVFAVGLDDQVYSQTFNSGGASASPYILTQPGQVKAVTADRFGAGVLFVLGLNDHVYEQKYDANGLSTGPYTLTRPGQVY